MHRKRFERINTEYLTVIITEDVEEGIEIKCMCHIGL